MKTEQLTGLSYQSIVQKTYMNEWMNDIYEYELISPWGIDKKPFCCFIPEVKG